MSFDLLRYLFTLSLLYIYGRMALHYGLIFIDFMLDQGESWKFKFEKPRLLFLLTGLVFMHLMIYSIAIINSENFLLRGIITSVFALALFLCHFPWTEKFKNNLLVQRKFNSKKIGENFDIQISNFQLQRLYDELVKYDLVKIDKTTSQDFKNVLTQNWNLHNSKIHFNMDGPSCREFFDHLVKTFPKNSLTLKSFFESSKLVLRADGKFFKYNTIKNVPTRSSISKKHLEIKEIFNKVNYNI